MVTKTNTVPLLADTDTDTVYFSNYLPKECPNLYKNLKQILKDNDVDCRLLKYTKDIWCRDFMPIQTEDKRFVSYKYLPNYLNDSANRKYITNVKKIGNIDFLKWGDNVVDLDLIIDGGNIVKCGDKIVMTEKVFVENCNVSHEEVVKRLTDAFQCEIVFIPWDYMHEKYGHSDGVVHYIGNNRVLMTNYEQFDVDMAFKFRRVLGEYFDVIDLCYDVENLNDNSWAYINFLQVGKLVLVPQLDCPEDKQALKQIKNAMPDCKIVGIPSSEAVNKGGALNCISWNVQLMDEEKRREKRREAYNKLAIKIVAQQQKEPWSLEEAIKQTIMLNSSITRTENYNSDDD